LKTVCRPSLHYLNLLNWLIIGDADGFDVTLSL